MRQCLIDLWSFVARVYYRAWRRWTAAGRQWEACCDHVDASTLVDQALQVIEAQEGGAVHPIRAVPLDIIAGALVHEMRETGATSGAALSAIVRRYAPPRVHVEQGSMFP